MTVGSIVSLAANETDQRKVAFAVQQLLERNGGKQVNASVATTISYSVSPTDYMINGAGNITVTLPSANSVPGQTFCIKKTDAAGTTITINPSTNTVDDSTAVTLTSSYQATIVKSDGVNWNTVLNPIPATLPTSSGGTGDTGTSWSTSFTPVVTSASGSLTATGTCRYKQIGKTVFISLSVTVSSSGTSSGALIITLPVAAGGSTSVGPIIPGIEAGLTSKAVTGFVAPSISSSAIRSHLYDGTFLATAGSVFLFNGVYESV